MHVLCVRISFLLNSNQQYMYLTTNFKTVLDNHFLSMRIPARINLTKYLNQFNHIYENCGVLSSYSLDASCLQWKSNDDWNNNYYFNTFWLNLLHERASRTK